MCREKRGRMGEVERKKEKRCHEYDHKVTFLSFLFQILLSLSGLARLAVYRSRLPRFVREFLSSPSSHSALRGLYPRQLFFLSPISTRHFPRTVRFTLVPSFCLWSVFPPFISPPASSLSRPRSPTYPAQPPPRDSPAETYFLERQSSAALSHFASIDRPRVVSQLTKSGFALRIHLRSAKSRSPVCTHRSC